MTDISNKRDIPIQPPQLPNTQIWVSLGMFNHSIQCCVLQWKSSCLLPVQERKLKTTWWQNGYKGLNKDLHLHIMRIIIKQYSAFLICYTYQHLIIQLTIHTPNKHNSSHFSLKLILKLKAVKVSPRMEFQKQALVNAFYLNLCLYIA